MSLGDFIDFISIRNFLHCWDYEFKTIIFCNTFLFNHQWHSNFSQNFVSLISKIYHFFIK